MARRQKLAGIVDRLDRYIDSSVDDLVEKVQKIVTRATARTEADLREALEREGRTLATVGANHQLVRSIDKRFLEHLNTLGYKKAVAEFREAMPGVAPFFKETFDAINATLKDPLPDPKLSDQDQRYFESQRVSTARVLNYEAENVARRAVSQAVLSLGAAPMRDLTERLAVSFGKLPSQLTSLAATAMSTHYRTIQSRAYKAVEDQSGQKLVYRYVGPRDKLNRPFCRRILRSNEPRTRKQIEGLSNGATLSNAFLNGGGYNCRHQWVAVGFEGRE